MLKKVKANEERRKIAETFRKILNLKKKKIFHKALLNFTNTNAACQPPLRQQKISYTVMSVRWIVGL